MTRLFTLLLALHVGMGMADNCAPEGGTWPNRSVVVTSILNSPFLYRKPDGNFGGFVVKMMDSVADKVGFQYELKLVEDGKYGKKDPSGRWNGMIGEVIDEAADMAVADLTVTSQRSRAVDFTFPFFTSNLAILIQKPKALDTQTNIFQVFSWWAWVGFLGLFVLVSVVLFLITSMNPPEKLEPRSNGKKFLDAFWTVYTFAATRNTCSNVQSLSSRLLLGVWMLVVLCFVSIFITGFIPRSMSRPHSPGTMEEFLRDRPDVVLDTIRGGSTERLLKESGHPAAASLAKGLARAQQRGLSQSLTAAVDRIKSDTTGTLAFIGEASSLRYVVARSCDLTLVPTDLAPRHYAIAVKPGSPLRQRLSLGILSISDELNLVYAEEAGSDRCLESNAQPNLNRYIKAVGLDTMAAPYLLMLVTSVVAAVIAFGEHYFCRRKDIGIKI